MTAKTCCEHHADQLPCGCNQGRACPARLVTKPGDAVAVVDGETFIASEPDSWEVILDLIYRFRVLFLIAAGGFAALGLYQLAEWATWPRLVYWAGL